MNKLMLLAACVLLVGCDYTAQLVKTPAIDIDRSVLGLWQRTDGKGQESLLVLPLGQKEYLVSYPAGSDDAMFARGSLWRGEGLTLVQLDWIGTAKGGVPEDNRTFQFAAYSLDEGTLHVRLLNPDEVKKDVQTAEALTKAIAEHRDSPNLFREGMVFRKGAH